MVNLGEGRILDEASESSHDSEYKTRCTSRRLNHCYLHGLELLHSHPVQDHLARKFHSGVNIYWTFPPIYQYLGISLVWNHVIGYLIVLGPHWLAR